jgi:uridine kinase
MIGDKLSIKEEHIKAATRLMELLLPEIQNSKGKLILTISGESGAGKSEIAAVLSQQLLEKGINNIILQQDDYFVYPPITNDQMRRKDINHVGVSEVRLELLDQNLQDILDGKREIQKPLVIYEEDKIITEKIKLEGIKVVIVEGTYTTLLKNVHRRIFIDRTYLQTKAARKERAREAQDEYLERILEIEHRIISSFKAKADIIVTSDYDVKEVVECDRKRCTGTPPR